MVLDLTPDGVVLRDRSGSGGTTLLHRLLGWERRDSGEVVAPRAERLPAEVSLGEQQRTAVARALVVRPRFLVADEPTGRLDEDLSAAVLATLRELCAAAGTGALVAGHDPVVRAAADRVVRLADGRVHGDTAVTPR